MACLLGTLVLVLPIDPALSLKPSLFWQFWQIDIVVLIFLYQLVMKLIEVTISFV